MSSSGCCEELLSAKRARVERPDRENATEAKERQQLLAEPRERSQTATHLLVEGGKSFQDSQSKITTATAELRELREPVAETVEELKLLYVNVVLQSAFKERAREEMDAQTTEMTELQERPAAQRVQLSQLSAKHGALTNVISRVKL